MSDLLSVKHLNKEYKTFALRDVSFSLPRGTMMGLIGPNGAGKTTTIKTLLGMVRPDGGDLTVLGCPADDPATREDLGVVMDLPFYVDAWTCEGVEAALRPFYRRWEGERYGALLKQFGIDRKKKVKELSRGMKVKLMLAAALAHRPRLLLLDEPTSGLDPVAREELLDLLAAFLQDEGNGVLYSTHITADLEKAADSITFLLNGQVVYTGGKDELIDRYRVVKGGPDEVPSNPHLLLGLRRHSTGFEAITDCANLAKLPRSLLVERASLEELIVFLNREGSHHA